MVTGGHDYATTFYTVFEGADDLHWDHAVSNHEAFKNDIRKNYDVLVLYDFSQEISDAEKTNLRNFVEAGKGIVVLHHAIADYQDWEWWYKEVVGGKYLLKAEGSMPAIDVPARSRVVRSARHAPPHHGPHRNHAPVGRNL